MYDEVDAYCSKHDPPPLAATCAATAPAPTTDISHRATSMTNSIADFLEPPVPVIECVAPAPDVTYTEHDPVVEHGTLAPVDVYTTPAPVIELMPAPVIEPSSAVSCPSLCPFIGLDK